MVGTPRRGVRGQRSALSLPLVFNNYALNRALLGRASVIHSHLLASPQRGRHDLARTIDDASGGAEREAHRTFRAFDHDRLARFIGRHRAGRISRGRFRRCRWLCSCAFCCRCACLRKRKWRN